MKVKFFFRTLHKMICSMSLPSAACHPLLKLYHFKSHGYGPVIEYKLTEVKPSSAE